MADSRALEPNVVNVEPIYRLPDELLELIILHLPPAATVALGLATRRLNKITYEPLVWRRHCTQTWKYWDPRHDLAEKLEMPPAQTKWHQLYLERQRIDREALEIFNELLTTQQYRYERLEKVAKYGYDVKDFLVRQRDGTPDDAADVLCRRFYADTILGQVHRATALEKWQRLQKRQMVRLEEVLGAYDLFVLSGQKGDLNDIDAELDRLAACVRGEDPEFDDLSIRQKAVRVATYLRSQNLVGNPSQESFHALRNNFISMALFDDVHTSLPLQSVAIYCAVARRLGVDAKPSNYPQHVHAVIRSPQDRTLDGKHKTIIQGAEPELMHMDPWRTDEEVPGEHLKLRLLQMGAPAQQHMQHLGPTTTFELALRTGRNIMNSVQESREAPRNASSHINEPDNEAAWYSMLWSMLILGDPSNAAVSMQRRRQCLPYLIEHFQKHFPEDLDLIEQHIPPMFETEREHEILMHLITTARAADQNQKAPTRRTKATENVHHKIGSHFRHKRYAYEGVIVGWDVKCSAEQRWIQQMQVDDLPRGREQPFYNVMYGFPSTASLRGSIEVYYKTFCVHPADSSRSADDKSVRYVAEENIEVLGGDGEGPSEALLSLAGRYFKRWDREAGVFVSNITDEYPDD